MKTNRLAWMLVIFFLEATVFQLPAQQTPTATNSYEEIEAKAVAGDAEAQFRLGLEAVRLAQTAASVNTQIRQSNSKADVSLPSAGDYDVQAYKWFCLAAAHTNFSLATDARKQLAGIIFFLSPEQLEKAKELVRTAEPDAEAKVEADMAADERKETPSPSSDSSILTQKPAASGTGFFITDDGYLISNYHVVKDATKVRLLTSAGLIDAKVVQVDAANDLALLKADGRFAPLPIAASRTVNLGGTVATVGFPDIGLQGFAPKLAKGEIASLSGAGDDPRYFQISVPVQPGNSGGALVDERGNVIGIVSAKLDASAALAASGALPENVNYAVKSSLLLSFLESVPAVSAKLKAPNTDDEV